MYTHTRTHTRRERGNIFLRVALLFVDFAPNQTLHMNPFFVLGQAEGFSLRWSGGLPLCGPQGTYVVRSFLCFYFTFYARN